MLALSIMLAAALEAKNIRKIWMAEVNYDIKYSGMSDEPDDMPMPSKAQLLVKGSNTCMIKDSRKGDGEFFTQHIIGNRDSMQLINLAFAPEVISATVCDSADIVAGQSTLVYDIKGKGLSKKILTYPCHGYDITVKDKVTGETFIEEVWSTDYIGGSDVNFYLYPEVKGVILYSKKTYGEEVTEMKANSVKKRVAMDAGTFSTPYGCEINGCGE